jgi:hypothetical protein
LREVGPPTAERIFTTQGQTTSRLVFQVTNRTLDAYHRATARGYLGTVFPADGGHMFYRFGHEVFDFREDGFFWAPVRPIGSVRYEEIVPLPPPVQRRIGTGLSRLKQTRGRELGHYDFFGSGGGRHCVSWFSELRVGSQGEDLVQWLGGTPHDGASLPAFARFMLERATPVEAVVLFDDRPRDQSYLQQMEFRLITVEKLLADHAARQRQAGRQ